MHHQTRAVPDRTPAGDEGRRRRRPTTRKPAGLLPLAGPGECRPDEQSAMTIRTYRQSWRAEIMTETSSLFSLHPWTNPPRRVKKCPPRRTPRRWKRGRSTCPTCLFMETSTPSLPTTARATWGSITPHRSSLRHNLHTETLPIPFHSCPNPIQAMYNEFQKLRA